MQVLRPLFTVLLFSFVFTFATAQDIVLEFFARHTCQQTDLDSIRIENLTQGGTMVLYHPDNTAVFIITGTGDPDHKKGHLQVSQNYPNPFSSLTYVDVFVSSPGRLFMEVYDLKGRMVSGFEDHLEGGMHRFSFGAGGDKTYILSVRSGRETQRRIMLQMGVTGAEAALTYLGKGDEDMKTSPKSDDFDFNPGDQLRFTGFVTDIEGNPDHGTIYDAPQTDTEYWFDIADTPPDMPSAIEGEDHVPVFETGLIYQVEETLGVDYLWTVPEEWVITEGEGTYQITVDAGDQGGEITVKAENACGESVASVLLVEVYVPMFELTLDASPPEGGDVSGQGSYPEGEEIPVEATPNEGWAFVNWTGDDGNEVSDQPAHTITMPSDDLTLTANFEMIDYVLTLVANPTEGGEVTGAGEYNFGDAVDIDAIPNEGWAFVNWTGDTDYIDDYLSASTNVIMPAYDITLTANFEMIDYMLTLVADPIEGGEVTGAGEYNFGDAVDIVANAHEGWEFAQWTGDTDHIDDPLSPAAIVTMPASDITLTAGFGALPVVQGTVTDLLEETPVEGALVKVYCADGDVLYGQTHTDTQGHYQLLLPLEDTQQHYLLQVTKEAFEDYLTWFTADAGSQVITLDVALTPVMYTVSGYVVDIFDEFGLENALISIDDNGIIKETYSDENGFFSVTVESSGYLFTTIEVEDYVKRHTWTTINDSTLTGGHVDIDFTIVPLTYPWSLYIGAFLENGGLQGIGYPQSKRDTTRHWVSPPNMHFFNDTLYVGGQNIDVQFSNLVYNAENILPTFNPRDALPENVVLHQEFGYTLQDNEKGAYFDDSISGAGSVLRFYAGPRMNRCLTRYRSGVGLQSPNNSVFNQELGSCFGAVREPAQSDEYSSVFADPPNSNSYTQDDYDSAKIMLDRARVHYRNLTYGVNEPEGWDWEMRPDEVEYWYSDEAVKETHLEIIVFGYEGEVLERTSYAYDEIPYTVMEDNPMLFTKEEVEQRKQEEKKVKN